MSKVDKSDPFPELPRRGLFCEVGEDRLEKARLDALSDEARLDRVLAAGLEQRPPVRLPLKEIVEACEPVVLALRGAIKEAGAVVISDIPAPTTERVMESVANSLARMSEREPSTKLEVAQAALEAGEKRSAHRPVKVGRPWEAMDPPIGRSEYYRRKARGEL